MAVKVSKAQRRVRRERALAVRAGFTAAAARAARGAERPGVGGLRVLFAAPDTAAPRGRALAVVPAAADAPEVAPEPAAEVAPEVTPEPAAEVAPEVSPEPAGKPQDAADGGHVARVVPVGTGEFRAECTCGDLNTRPMGERYAKGAITRHLRGVYGTAAVAA